MIFILNIDSIIVVWWWLRTPVLQYVYLNAINSKHHFVYWFVNPPKFLFFFPLHANTLNANTIYVISTGNTMIPMVLNMMYTEIYTQLSCSFSVLFFLTPFSLLFTCYSINYNFHIQKSFTFNLYVIIPTDIKHKQKTNN